MENPRMRTCFVTNKNVKFSVYPNLYKLLATSFLHLPTGIVAK